MSTTRKDRKGIIGWTAKNSIYHPPPPPVVKQLPQIPQIPQIPRNRNNYVPFSSSTTEDSSEESSLVEKRELVNELNSNWNELAKIKEKMLELDIDDMQVKVQNIDSYYNQKISKLKSEIKDLRSLKEMNSVDIQGLRSTIDDLSAEKDANSVEIDSLHGTIEDLSGEKKANAEIIENLSSELNQLREKTDMLSAVVSGNSFSSLTDEELDELLQKIMDEKTNRTRCVVCLEKPRSMVCTPCGHFCLCNICSKGTKNCCPICRCKVLSFTKIYT